MPEEGKYGRSVAGQKSSMGGRGNPEKASPATVERYLKGIHYPCSKRDLVSRAQENEASSDVMHVINAFEEKQYGSTIDVSKEVGRVDRERE